MARLAALLLAASAPLASAAAASFCDAPGFARVFEDEFSGGALDAASWSASNGTAREDSSCREAMCLSRNVGVAGGALTLTSRREAAGWASFTTGAVNSQGKRFWPSDPGFRVCVSAQLPGGGVGGAKQGAGYWPAIWMMPNDASCWPDHGEHDIMEMINGDGNDFGSYHVTVDANSTCKYSDAGGNTAGARFVPGFNSSFHEYAMERTPTSYSYAVDGVVFFNSSLLAPGVRLVNTSWYIILNLAIGGPWPEPPTDETVFPALQLFDYVRVAVPTAAALGK